MLVVLFTVRPNHSLITSPSGVSSHTILKARRSTPGCRLKSSSQRQGRREEDGKLGAADGVERRGFVVERADIAVDVGATADVDSD